jgi:sugar phosphate isomerase/epimerase
LAAAGRVGDDRSPYVIKRDGVDGLEDGPRETVKAFLAELAQYGIFVVPVGELENWLEPLAVTNKQRWVTEMLVRLGTKGTATYVPPGTGDVWEFVESIAAWTNDPARFGLPTS